MSTQTRRTPVCSPKGNGFTDVGERSAIVIPLIAHSAVLGVIAVARNPQQPLSAVEYLDSAAISVLFPHAEHIHLIAHPLLIRIFTISGLGELTTIEPAPPKTEH